ncbi:hypothetical protein DSCO28_36590 [Desulfosarcina ovata subsp. sediminis]|uniref:Tetratricopeptide repeat protein n=1 Tax=Desulfosarcina ovata subsp. sediminis TaxID=885957 RepID=A0A5K7ZSA6_9BACT|nr:hypothetical protein [Desulfosarcina ovata]BBO83093.1 hypothetical protein DSCO28_36590 [Desulfosarcina ovata subsp. sediminis]
MTDDAGKTKFLMARELILESENEKNDKDYKHDKQVLKLLLEALEEGLPAFQQAVAYEHIASLYFKNNELENQEKSIKYYEKFFSLEKEVCNEENASFWSLAKNDYGLLLLSNPNWDNKSNEEKRQSLKEIIEKTDHPLAHNKLSWAYLLDGYYDDAESHWQYIIDNQNRYKDFGCIDECIKDAKIKLGYENEIEEVEGIEGVDGENKSGSIDVIRELEEIEKEREEVDGENESGSFINDFYFKRDFKRIKWKETLWLNFIRAFFAGIVYVIICIFAGEGNTFADAFKIILIFPFSYLFVILPMGLFMNFLSGIGVPFVGLVGIIFSLIVVLGDPIVFAIHKLKPTLVPVKKFRIINFRLIIFILDNLTS